MTRHNSTKNADIQDCYEGPKEKRKEKKEKKLEESVTYLDKSNPTIFDIGNYFDDT